MDWGTLGIAMGSAWLSGINLYATVATLGILQKFGFVTLPGELGILSNSWVLGVAGVMYVVEFFADKIPALDSAWDAVHTFIRVPAGAVLAATAFADFDPTVKTIAMLVGGGVALGSHGLKATTRLAANTSPEPFSNIALSVSEDVLTIGSTILMVVSPIAILIIVLLFIILLIWLVPKIFRTLRRLMRKMRSWFSSTPEGKIVES
jgi:ABC-type multidrug transport system fused ATPase/permease subunit